MGIFDALTTAVSGLSAQSFALQNISGNIANASTVGYKGIDTTFEDLIPNATVANKQVAGGVTAFSAQTITTQGTVSNSTVATNMAINGDGFFSVQKPSSVSDNVPVFSGVTDYTRRGDFQVDANGNLVNGAGYYLMGVDVDPKTGNPTGNVPHVLQFQNNFIPAQATTAITYAANLPTTPKTSASTGAAAKTITADGGLNPNDFSANPTVVGTAAPSVDATSVGAAANSQTGSAISSATALSGTSGSDSLSTGFAAGDTITVDGTVISFVSGATNLSANQISITDNVGTLMSAIGNITGVTPTIAANGAITLHTGTAQNLSITTSGANATNAMAAMGITAPVNQAMGVGTNTGLGYVAGSDVTTFTNESISGGAVTAYNAAGTPVNVQLRWAKVDSASLGTGHQDVWNL